MPWCALLTAVKNYNKSLEKLHDFFFKTENKTKTKCSRPRPRLHDPRPRPRLSFLSSRRLETKTLVIAGFIGMMNDPYPKVGGTRTQIYLFIYLFIHSFIHSFIYLGDLLRNLTLYAHSKQKLHGDQTTWEENFYRVYLARDSGQKFRWQMPTWDLFAVAFSLFSGDHLRPDYDIPVTVSYAMLSVDLSLTCIHLKLNKKSIVYSDCNSGCCDKTNKFYISVIFRARFPVPVPEQYA